MELLTHRKWHCSDGEDGMIADRPGRPLKGESRMREGANGTDYEVWRS